MQVERHFDDEGLSLSELVKVFKRNTVDQAIMKVIEELSSEEEKNEE